MNQPVGLATPPTETSDMQAGRGPMDFQTGRCYPPSHGE